MTPVCHHPYVSHLVRVAPGPAGIGLDFARSCLSVPGTVKADDEHRWTVSTPAGTLRLAGPLHRVEPGPRRYRPHRVAVGTLQPAGRGRAVEVTLDLLPWSSRWSELALTTGPVRRTAAGSRAERSYLLAAHATLDRLVKAIEAPPAEWLTRLVAGQPLPKSEHVALVDRTGREGCDRAG